MPSELWLLLLACGGPGDGSGPGDTDGDGDTDTEPAGVVALTDPNNYTFASRVDAPTIVTAAATDVRFDWATLTSDMLCHATDPVADIDNVALLAFPNLTEAEVEVGLALDSLQQADLGGYISMEPGDATSAWLTDLTFFGTDPQILDQYTEGRATWLLLLSSGTTVGVGARTIAFLEPRDDSDVTDIVVPDGCGLVDVDVDIDALAPVTLPPTGPWVVDWRGVTADGQGQPLDRADIDGILLARYDETTAEIEADFLDVEILPEQIWRASVSGASSIDLTALVDPEGVAFAGFDGGGTWLLALVCGTCSNPAPRFLTRVVVE